MYTKKGHLALGNFTKLVFWSIPGQVTISKQERNFQCLPQNQSNKSTKARNSDSCADHCKNFKKVGQSVITEPLCFNSTIV